MEDVEGNKYVDGHMCKNKLERTYRLLLYIEVNKVSWRMKVEVSKVSWRMKRETKMYIHIKQMYMCINTKVLFSRVHVAPTF